jgi:2-phospho-L-lactate guanylyltransferase (CobY/MobA/RfbA family)
MSLPFSSSDLNTRLDQLLDQEKRAELEKNQINDLLRMAETMEQKMKLIDALTSINNHITSIQNERLKIIDLMTKSIEIGKRQGKNCISSSLESSFSI